MRALSILGISTLATLVVGCLSETSEQAKISAQVQANAFGIKTQMCVEYSGASTADFEKAVQSMIDSGWTYTMGTGCSTQALFSSCVGAVVDSSGTAMDGQKVDIRFYKLDTNQIPESLRGFVTDSTALSSYREFCEEAQGKIQ